MKTKKDKTQSPALKQSFAPYGLIDINFLGKGFEVKLKPTVHEVFADNIIPQVDEYMIEGLKRKGFEFKTKRYLVNFLKSNCKTEDRHDIKQRTYFVNDIPFLLHRYHDEKYYAPIETDSGFEITAPCGSFSYL
jgi:hypothetical protein